MAKRKNDENYFETPKLYPETCWFGKEYRSRSLDWYACGAIVDKFFRIPDKAWIVLCVTDEPTKGAVRANAGFSVHQPFDHNIALDARGWRDGENKLTRDLYWWVEVKA